MRNSATVIPASPANGGGGGRNPVYIKLTNIQFKRKNDIINLSCINTMFIYWQAEETALYIPALQMI